MPITLQKSAVGGWGEVACERATWGGLEGGYLIRKILFGMPRVHCGT